MISSSTQGQNSVCSGRSGSLGQTQGWRRMALGCMEAAGMRQENDEEGMGMVPPFLRQNSRRREEEQVGH